MILDSYEAWNMIYSVHEPLHDVRGDGSNTGEIVGYDVTVTRTVASDSATLWKAVFGDDEAILCYERGRDFWQKEPPPEMATKLRLYL